MITQILQKENKINQKRGRRFIYSASLTSPPHSLQLSLISPIFPSTLLTPETLTLALPCWVRVTDREREGRNNVQWPAHIVEAGRRLSRVVLCVMRGGGSMEVSLSLTTTKVTIDIWDRKWETEQLKQKQDQVVTAAVSWNPRSENPSYEPRRWGQPTVAGWISGYTSRRRKESNSVVKSEGGGEEDPGSNTQWQTQNPNSTISLI